MNIYVLTAITVPLAFIGIGVGLYGLRRNARLQREAKERETCPHSHIREHTDRVTARYLGRYRCADCGQQVTKPSDIDTRLHRAEQNFNNQMSMAYENFDRTMELKDLDLAAVKRTVEEKDAQIVQRDQEIAKQSQIISDQHARIYLIDHPEETP